MREGKKRIGNLTGATPVEPCCVWQTTVFGFSLLNSQSTPLKFQVRVKDFYEKPSLCLSLFSSCFFFLLWERLETLMLRSLYKYVVGLSWVHCSITPGHRKSNIHPGWPREITQGLPRVRQLVASIEPCEKGFYLKKASITHTPTSNNRLDSSKTHTREHLSSKDDDYGFINEYPFLGAQRYAVGIREGFEQSTFQDGRHISR